MRRRDIAGLVVIAVVVAATMLYFNFAGNREVKVDIKAPATFEPGQLIELDASSSLANTLTWRVLPQTVNFRIIDGGRRAVFSGNGNVEVYTIFVAGCYNERIASVVHTLKLKIKENVKSKLNSFQKRVISWIPANATHDEVIRLSQSFKSMASLITNGRLKETDDIIKATTWSNKEALGDSAEKWRPFFSELQDYLESGPIEDHATKWREIALALDTK